MTKILEGFIWRKLVGRRRALVLLGARSVREEDGSKSARLKLASRSYRSGQRASGLGYAASADTPTIHVMLGVSVRPGEQPVYRVRRFVASEEGGFNEVGGYHATDAAEAFVAFLSNPELAQLTEEEQNGQEQGSTTNTASREPRQGSEQAA